MIPVRFTFLLLLVGLIVFPLVVRADNGTWAGDLSGSWSDPAKWVGPTVADGADYTASFATNISVARTVTLDSSRTIGHLTFQDTSSLYQGWTLAGTNVLTLAVGSGTPQVNVKTASATAGATISLTLSGTNGLEKLGVAPLVLSGTNTVSGGVTISQGALTVAADGNLGAAANDIIFAGGAQLTAGGFATARNMVINAGAVATNSVAGLFTVNGSISGSGTLRKADTGVLVLNGTNTYGATVIAAGELRATDGVGVSSGNVNILGGGVWSSSANISRALGLGDDQVQFTGDAGFSAYGAPIDVNLGGGADSISWGAGAFGTPTPFYLNNINANAMLTLRNAINLNGNTAQISTLANVAELAGVISNSTATAGLTKAGSGVLWLTATNAFNGTITVDGAGGALRAVDGIGIPSTVNVNLSNDGVWESPVDITRPLGTNASEVRLTGAGGDGFSACGAPIRVDLGGAGATLVWGGATFTTGLVLNQISADNAITLVNGLDLNGGGRTVIVNSPVHAAIISGVISHSSGSAMLTKSGAGTLILGATNTWSHTSVTGTNLNIVAGVVQVEREENLGGNPAGVFMAKCLLLNGGTLKTTASCSIDDSNRGIMLGGAHGWFDVTGGTVLTIDNVIAGTTGNLYKRGGGTLILANTSNTYGTTTVGTHLQEGVLAISADGNLGAVSADLYFDTNSTLKATATATLNSGRAVSIAAGVNATVECDASVVLTLAGAISSGPGALTKTGPGTLILGGLNLHDGGTIIEAGTLKCGLANTFAAGTTGDIVINADGILDVGGVGIAPNGMVSGSGTIDNSAGTGTLALGAGNGSSTFDGVFKNSGGTLNLTKTGTGTFTLTNPTNSYGGLTTISGGTIKLGASEVIPHGAGKGNIAITTANTCILDMNGHDETINGFGTSAGLVTNSTGSALLTIGADGLTVASSSVVIKDGGPSAPLALTKTGTGTHTLAGIISLCGPVTIDGGTLILSGANTYTNMTRINTGATLQAGAVANKLSDFSDVIVNGGTLNMTYADAVSSVTLKNNGSITNVATLTSMAGYIVESGTIASALASAAGLTKNTSGTVDLGGANTYAGATVVNDGILRITASDRLANVSALTVNGGAFDLGSYNDQVGVVTLIGGTITSSGGMLTGSVYYVESGTITAKLGGIGIALNKAASGTVILSGDNTYSGATLVSNGMLLVNGSQPSSAVTVADAATLGGGGTCGAITVSGGGMVDPGDGIGDRTLNASSLTLSATNSGCVFEFASVSDHDQIILDGALNVGNGGAIYLNDGDGHPFAISGGPYQLIRCSNGSGPVTTLTAPQQPAGIHYTFNIVGGWLVVEVSGFAIWSGQSLTDARWSRGVNWVGGEAPADHAVLTFAGVDRVANFNDFTGYTLGGITFDATAGEFVLSGNAVNLLGKVVNNSSLPQTVDLPLVLVSSSREITAASGNITISQVISDGVDTLGITKTGGGILRLTAGNTYKGTTVIDGGALEVGAGGDTGSLGSGDTVNNSSLVFNRSDEACRYSGTISGTGAVTNGGSGTVIFDGANNYQGVTTISAGAIRIEHPSALGAVGADTVVHDGAALQINGSLGNIAAEPMTLNGMGIAGTNGALRNISGNSTNTGLITLGSASRIHSISGTLTLNPSAGPAITGAGNLTFGGEGNITVSKTIASPVGNLTKDGGGTLILGIAGNTYTGSTTIAGGVLKKGITGNVIPDASALVVDGGTYDMNGTAETVGAITVRNGGNIIGGAFVLTPGGPMTVESGLISVNLGATTNTLVKNTSGTFILSGANTFTGQTRINEGTLRATTVAGALGGAGTLVLNGGVLELANDTALTPSKSAVLVSGDSTIRSDRLTGGGGVTHILGTLGIGDQTLSVTNGTNVASGTAGITFGIPTLSGNPVFDVGNSAGVTTVLTLGALADGGAARVITKRGGGTLILGAAAGSLVNGTIINIAGGTLNANIAGAPGTLAAVDVADGAVFTTSFAQTLGALSNSGSTLNSGGVIINAAVALTVGNAANNLASAFSGVISGASGQLTKAGGGMLTLSGNNSYGGLTTVGAGGLRIGHNNALGAIAANTVVSAGSVLELTGDINTAEPLSLNGAGLAAAPAGVLRNVSGTNTCSGLVTLATASTIVAADGALVFDVSSGNAIARAALALTFDGDGALTVNDPIAGTTGALVKNGGGTLTLNAATAGTGATTVSNGTLRLGGGASVGTGAITMSGGMFDLGGNTQASGILTLNDGRIMNGMLGLAVTAPSIKKGEIGAGLVGSGAMTKSTADTVILSGNNSGYTGNISLTGGILNIRHNNALGTGGTTTAGAGAVLELEGNIDVPAETTFTLAGTLRNVSGTNTYRGALAISTNAATITALAGELIMDVAGTNVAISRATGALTVNGAGNVTIPAAITGTTIEAAVIKDGAGTLVLGGTNTYTGVTTVNGGSLIINGAIGGNGAVNVNGGATLGGNGAMAGPVAASSGATLVPGNPAVANGVGVMTVGGLALQAGSILRFQLDDGAGDDDVIDASAGVTAITGGNVYLYNAATGGDFKEDGVYRLIRYSGAAPSVTGLSVQTDIAGKSYKFRAVAGWVELTINSEAIISIDSPGVLEGHAGETNLAFNVSLPFAATGAVSVAWQTSDGTAKAGLNDYTPDSGTVNFSIGDTNQQIVVKVNGDTQKEPDETLTVTLSGAAGGLILDATGTGTLINDDPFTVWYMDPAATSGANNGYSWEDAFTNLNSAFATDLAGQPLWVVGGTYYPGATREATFMITSSVTVLGGFATGMGAEDQRDWLVNPTVLSGDIDQNGVLDASNSLHVVTVAAQDVALDGLTLTMGYARDAAGAVLSGGALYASNCYPVVRNCRIVTNSASQRGGGVYLFSGAAGTNGAVFQGCEIAYNTTTNTAANMGGGGICAHGQRPVRVDGCRMTGNQSAVDGGGLLAYNGVVQILGSDVDNNQSRGAGAGVAITGTRAAGQRVEMRNSRFYVNRITTTTGDGGAVSADGANEPEDLISHCQIYANEARYGGALNLVDYDGLVEACTISGNRATGSYGGAVNLSSGCEAVFRQVSIAGHSSATGGGGVYAGANNRPTFENVLVAGNRAGTAGGGIYLSDLNVAGAGPTSMLAHCTVADNRTTMAAAANGGGGLYITDGTATVYNTIFWGNVAATNGHQIRTATKYIRVDMGGDLIQDGSAGVYNPSNWPLTGLDNQLANSPLFATAGRTWTVAGVMDTNAGLTLLTDTNTVWATGAMAGLYVNPATTDNLSYYIASNTVHTLAILGLPTNAAAGSSYRITDYRPGAPSPCIDAATNLIALTNDIVNTARPQGAASDIGAYEVVPDGTAPDPVTGLTATGLLDAIRLDWTNPSSGLAGVLVLRKRESAPTGMPVSTNWYQAGSTLGDGEVVYVGAGISLEPGASSQWTDELLPNTSHWHYAVFAYDTVPNYAVGADAETATLIDDVPPQPPTSFHAAGGTRQIALSWQNSTSVDQQSVLIVRRTGAVPTGVPVNGTPYGAGQSLGDGVVVNVDVQSANTAGNWTDQGLSDGLLYCYQVFACDEALQYSTAASAQDYTRIPGVWFVNHAAAGGNTGISWNDAYTDLAVALASSSAGEQIWVAKGTYYPNAKASTFTMRADVAVYGGFAGAEVARVQRNWTANVTILSGDIGVKDDPSDNCPRVVTAPASAVNATLDGFTVERAYGTLSGANMLIQCVMLVDHCVFQQGYGNEAGAIHMSAGATIRNTIFRNNSSGSRGGAVQCYSSSPVFENCMFYDNYCGGVGGAVSLYHNPMTFKHCVFIGNMAASGANCAWISNYGTPSFYNCILWDSGDHGSGLFAKPWNEINEAGSTFLYNCDLREDFVPVDPPHFGGSYVGAKENCLIGDDPQFVSESMRDLHLLAGSPCINKGDSGNSTPSDFDGVERDAQPDIGPYEGAGGSVLPNGLIFMVK